MLGNYLKIAIRNLRKNKLHAAVNIFGLAVGLAATLAIVLYVRSEYSYDGFHTKSNRLYRVGFTAYREGKKVSEGSTFTPPVGPDMKAEMAGVQNYTRYAYPRAAYLSADGQTLKTENVLYADSTFFDLFSFRLQSGNPRSALAAPYSVVLTEALAKRLFPHENPLGKSIRLNNGKDLRVTGLAQNPPANSHIDFQALISFSTLYDDPANFMGWDGGEQYVTYVLLAEHADPRAVAQNFPAFLWRHINEKYAAYGIRVEASLQPLPEVHLHFNEYSAGLRTNLWALAAMAALILLIACINFINLATAKASRRAAEVGVRKVLGADRLGLARQFAVEICLSAGLALLAALLLLQFLLPLLPRLLGKALVLPDPFHWQTIGGLAALFVLVCVAAGGYPAFYLSSLDPVRSLKKLRFSSSKSALRNTLVVFQFSISTALIAGALVVFQQLRFAQTKALGFEKENIIVAPLVGEAVQSKVDVLRAELKKAPGVSDVAAGSEMPGEGFTTNGYQPEGVAHPLIIHAVDVGEGYLPLFNLEIVKGRGLSPAHPSDQSAYLINETLAKQLGWDNPLGKKINRNGSHEVVGVVRDFHFASLHEPIEPLIVTCAPWNGRFDYLAIKIAPGDLPAAIGSVRRAWDNALPGTPLEFRFLDEQIDRIYQTERRLGEAFLWFSGLSILIALLGISGLTAFATEQRTKEIGVRKVLGAGVASIVGLLSADFLKLVGIAVLLASPLAYWLMQRWLENFAYRIDLQWWMFAASGAAAVLVAFLTVSFQSVRAALANPVQALRSE